MLIAVGAGTIHDLRRDLSLTRRGIAFVSQYPTTARVDGFVSSRSSNNLKQHEKNLPLRSPTVHPLQYPGDLRCSA